MCGAFTYGIKCAGIILYAYLSILVRPNHKSLSISPGDKTVKRGNSRTFTFSASKTQRPSRMCYLIPAGVKPQVCYRGYV